MSLAWLLFARSFRHNWQRFLLLTIALGAATLLVFVCVTGLNGLDSRMRGVSLQQTIIQSSSLPHQQTSVEQYPLYAILSSKSSAGSLWRDKEITVTRLAATSSESPDFQGMPTPNLDEYYVSSGLKRVMDKHPEDNIGSRFGNKLLGTIPNKYVSSPDELTVVSGISLSEVKELELRGASVVKIYGISMQPAVDTKYSSIVTPVLYLGMFVLLFPIVLLISVATRLGGSQRERRYAALRLIGATRDQVRRVLVVESVVVSAAGIVVGLLLYAAIQPLILEFKFSGMRFWPHEVDIPLLQGSAIAIAIIILSTTISWWSMRRVQISPLGMVRKNKRRKEPHWRRLAPLTLGISTVGFVMSPLYNNLQDTYNNMAILLIFTSLIVLSFGIITAGPLITQKLANFFASHTRHAEVLIGMKYAAFNSGGVFRTVSGAAIALFIGSFLLVCADSMRSYMAKTVNTDAYSQLQPNAALIGTHIGSDLTLPAGQETTFKDLEYIKSVTEVKQVSYAYVVMPCQAVAKYLKKECPDNAEYIARSFNYEASPDELYGSTEAEVYEKISKSSPYANIAVVEPNYLVQVDFSDIDKLRSFISNRYESSTYLFDGTSSNTPFIHPIIKEAAELARAGIVMIILISLVSLAVSSIGALLEQRHSLTSLRVGGMSVSSLKRVVIIESLLPLLSVTLISSALGLVVGAILMHRLELLSSIHDMLSISYITLIGGCIVASLMMNVYVLSFVDKVTNPDNMRVE